MARKRLTATTLESWTDVDACLKAIGEVDRELAILDYNSDHRDAFEEGEAKGRAEGIEKGRAEERKSSDNRWEKLMGLLLEEKRYDEAKKAASSKEFRETLFKKYGLE